MCLKLFLFLLPLGFFCSCQVKEPKAAVSEKKAFIYCDSTNRMVRFSIENNNNEFFVPEAYWWLTIEAMGANTHVLECYYKTNCIDYNSFEHSNFKSVPKMGLINGKIEAIEMPYQALQKDTFYLRVYNMNVDEWMVKKKIEILNVSDMEAFDSGHSFLIKAEVVFING